MGGVDGEIGGFRVLVMLFVDINIYVIIVVINIHPKIIIRAIKLLLLLYLLSIPTTINTIPINSKVPLRQFNHLKRLCSQFRSTSLTIINNLPISLSHKLSFFINMVCTQLLMLVWIGVILW